MIIVIEQVLLLVVFAAIGYALAKGKKADSKHAKLLSCLELYVFLPATVFNTFANNFTPEYLVQKYPLLLVSAAILIVTVLAAQPIAKCLSKDPYQQNVLRYSLAVPNYGYIGYALAGGIFGSQMLLNVMIFALPLSLYTYTAGYCMLTKTKLSVKRLFNPVTLALFAGAVVGLCGIDLPQVADTFLSKAAGCMAPVSMLLTGIVISEYKLTSLLSHWYTYLVAALRLIVLPCAAALILLCLSLQEAVIPTLMVMAMPCGLNTIVFPKLVGESCETGASLAFVTSLLCCITIPLCLFFFGSGVF